MRLSKLRAPKMQVSGRRYLEIVFDDVPSDSDLELLVARTNLYLKFKAARRFREKYHTPDAEWIRFFGVAVLKTDGSDQIGDVHFFLSGQELCKHIDKTGRRYRVIVLSVADGDSPVPSMRKFLRRHRVAKAHHWSMQLMHSMAQLLIERWTHTLGTTRKIAAARLREHILQEGAGIRTLAPGESVWYKPSQIKDG